MSSNFINITLSNVEEDNLENVSSELTETVANIIGTSYKGPAFVPKKIYFSETINNNQVYNTKNSIFGTQRQNQIGHLYDEMSCFADSSGYDALNIWLSNGGEFSYFTRTLGIGLDELNSEDKMSKSGFNAAEDISYGNLLHTKSENINAISGGTKGNVTFFLRTLNEESKRSNSATPTDDQFIDETYVDYINEIGFYKQDNNNLFKINENTNFISDVVLFPKGVLPSLEKNITSNPFKYSTIASSYNDQVKSFEDSEECSVILKGFKPFDLRNENKTQKTFDFIKIDSNHNSNRLYKQTHYFNYDKNYFSSKFLERGHLSYSSYSFSGINKSIKENHNFKILTAIDYNDVKQDLTDEKVPDYNSFESEFTTAKTPWITSQPINRNSILDNRININKNTIDLFRFHSLDDGEVGNRFRIKVNITKRGSQRYDKNFNNLEFCEFNISILEYEVRNNSFIVLEEYFNLNLNPNSKKYISRVIGDFCEFYDIKSKKVYKTGKFKNKSKFLRVEVKKEIEDLTYTRQHQLLPSGFRSYPHIKLIKNSFKNWMDDDTALDNTFDTEKVFHLPPMYSLNYYEDYSLGINSSIKNNWGVIFTPADVIKNIQQPKFNNFSGEASKEYEDSISPHYFYTKYFLSGITNDKSYKNVLVNEDNYLNSFFHLEKIIINDDNKNYNILNRKNMQYKHSGRPLKDNSNFVYINLDSDDFWSNNDILRPDLKDKLSFDLFTYGGFDGVDVRDYDKKYMKNDAIIRENIDTNEYKTTELSYKRSIDLATNEAYTEFDIILTPGIRELSILNKIVSLCESRKKYFFIADVSGSVSKTKKAYVQNQTQREITSSYGIMGNYFLVSESLSNYIIDEIKCASNDKRFKIDENSYFSYEKLLQDQFDNIISSWKDLSINSRYFMPVLGEVLMSSVSDDNVTVIKKKLCPEAYILAKIALTKDNPRTSISSFSIKPRLGDNDNIIFSVLDKLNNFENIFSFEDNSQILRQSNINLIYQPKFEGLNILSENTSYENRKTIFKKQSIVRTINLIKKSLKYNLFTDTSLIEGGILFTQNSNFKNIYQKLEIQLDVFLRKFVEQGLIEDYRINIAKLQDEKTILDMQNYIIRGNIVLQFENSTIINLRIDDILNDLSILSGDLQDSVQIISI